MVQKRKLLICEDHTLMRRGLLRLLTTLIPPQTVFLEAENGWVALDLLHRHPDTDLILLDIQMEGLNGFDTLREIRKRALTVPVIILTQFEEKALADNLRRYGISAFLPKNTEPLELKAAIEVALAGSIYYNDLLTKENPGTPPRSLLFSPREMEIIRLLAAGYTSIDIAKQIGISVTTVNDHRRTILEKTKTKNVAELIGLAGKTGLL
ncbi:MAG: response regulator [Cyclobacteriaceae bacterium]|jgi:two-component system response regulator NreC